MLSSLSAHLGVILSAYRMERSLGGIGENFGMEPGAIWFNMSINEPFFSVTLQDSDKSC